MIVIGAAVKETVVNDSVEEALVRVIDKLLVCIGEER